MSNEVEIVITGRDRSGPAMASARARAQQTGAQIRQSLSKAGRDGGRDMGGGISDGIESGTRRGGQIVSGFASSVLSSFGKLGPGMGAAITAGVYGAAASAGAAAGGIALAVGGALTGIGVVSAAQSVRVRREWSDVGRELQASLADAAQPMERSALRAATVTRNTFSRLKPYLSNFFADSAPAVDRFVKSIGNGVASLGPALVPLRRGYTAVLDAISNRSPAIFGALERSLQNIGDIAERNADDIASAFEFAAGAVEKTTEALGFLADQWDGFTSSIEAADQAGQDFGGGFRETLYEWARALGIDTEQMRETEASWAAVDRAAANNGGVKDASSAATDLGGAAGDAAAGLRDLKAELENLNGPALDAAEAQIRVEEAIDRAAEAARKNGRTLDVNTEKGRANKESLIGIARAAQDHIVAMQAEEATATQITAKYGEYRGALVRAARQAGLTRGQAERLAEAWLAMPDSVVTKARAETSDLESKIAAAKAKLRDPKLTRPERAHIRAEIGDLQRKVAAAKAALSSIKSRSVSVFINQIYRQSGVGVGTVLAPGRAHGGVIGGLGGIKRFAQGGVSGSGSSLAMVGEQGPELVRLPVGSTVTPAGQTRAQMAQSGFGSISMAFRGRSGGSDTGGLTSSVRDLTKALREVISLREGMSRFTDSVFGQSRALIAYEAAWDNIKKSIKENGKTLNISKEKGRENREALLGLADAAHSVVFAMRDMNKPISTIVAKMKEQRSEFIKAAKSFGLTTAQARKLADAYGLIPSKVKSVLTKEAKDIKYNKAAEKYNNSLDGKASGGIAGGWTMVGERGAELVRLPFGSSVVPSGQSAAMVAGGGRAAPVVIELRSSGSAVDDMLVKILRTAIRDRGGNVQAVLGRA